MTSPPPNPRHRHRHRHRLLLLQLFVGGVSLATSATAAKSVYTVVEGGSTKDVDACRLGREEVGTAGFECTRITADLDAIRTATEIEFDGSVYMAVEKEIKHKEAAAFSFISQENGGMATFIVMPDKNGSNFVNGKIDTGPGRPFYQFDSCDGEDCTVLVKFETVPKLEKRFADSGMRFDTTAIGSSRTTLADIEASLPTGALSKLRAKNLNRATCSDNLNYVMCGMMMEFTACLVMNSMWLFGAWVPCAASCGACCADSNYGACWLIGLLYFPWCGFWSAQCRASCNTCNPITGIFP